MKTIIVNLAVCAVAFCMGRFVRRLVDRWRDRRQHWSAYEEAAPDISVEVDCRACGQFNRVPSHRLLEHPKCGRCKARLMPGKRVVLCRVRPMDGLLSSELDELWEDADGLWQCLAGHVAAQSQTQGEAEAQAAPRRGVRSSQRGAVN